MSKVRYHSLDSLRGIASLQVLIGHSMVAVPLLASLVYTNPNEEMHCAIFCLIHSPISFLWSDSAAVKVFFVLSGFVLSLSYYTEDKRIPYYPAFFIKRIIRLYLPCLAIILISLFCQRLLYAPNQVNEFGSWIQQVWAIPLNFNVVINLLTLGDQLDYFDRALWTLSPEIKLSLILPFTIYILKRLNKFWTLVFLIIYILLWHLLNKMGARNVWPDFPVLYFFTFFMLGSIVCKYRLLITDWIDNIPALKFYLFVALMLAFYTYSNSIFWLPSNLKNPLNSINDYVSALAAVMILCIALSHRAQPFLNTKVFEFLGKISFSLYLIHIIVITVFAYLLHNYFPPGVVVAIGVLFCFPLAMVFYKYIEFPSLVFANYFSKLIIENRYSKMILSLVFK